jgi:hypothetical protein
LYDTGVSDAGLKDLAALQHLKELNLSGTQITDAGLKQLAGFPQLQVLYLNATKVSDAGINELRKSLPMCQIQR